MLTLQQMHYILVLSEQKQFQRASQECFVTQPTLSMQIKKAEDDLGYAIFDRSRQPLELTPFGERLIPIIRETLSEAEKIKTITNQMKGQFKERIRIGIIPTVAVYLVPDLFSQWIQSLKDVQLNIVEMKSEDLLLALERKEIDAAILAGPVHDDRHSIVPLFTEEIYAYLPKQKSKIIGVEELTQLRPWLLSSGNCLRTQMIRLCQIAETSEHRDWNYEGGNLNLLIKMAEQYGGYTLVPEYFHVNKDEKNHLKRINSLNSKSYPAREIICMSSRRSIKWTIIERIIRDIQLHYGKKSNDKFEILEWK